MIISAIAAMDWTGLIGRGGKMPWHLPRDLKRFRKLTLGKPIILGRKTLDSIGGPLPGRLNIVLTRNTSFEPKGCQVARSIGEALQIAEESGTDEAMIIGGGVIYKETAPLWDRVLLTVVLGEFQGDTYFPVGGMSSQPWGISAREYFPADGKNPYPHWFLDVDRQGPDSPIASDFFEWLRDRSGVAADLPLTNA